MTWGEFLSHLTAEQKSIGAGRGYDAKDHLQPAGVPDV